MNKNPLKNPLMQSIANKAQEFKVIILDKIGVIAEPINDAIKIYFLFSIFLVHINKIIAPQNIPKKYITKLPDKIEGGSTVQAFSK
jgi:hypothetical protein